jgi:hypothetical protein
MFAQLERRESPNFQVAQVLAALSLEEAVRDLAVAVTRASQEISRMLR